MQILRTIIWVLLLVALALFSAFNWTPVEVKIWEGLVLETKIPALVLISFLIGLVPMWLYHRGTKWQLKRRIAALESAARTAAATPFAAPEDIEPIAEPVVATPVTPAPVETAPVATVPVEPVPEERKPLEP